MSDTSLAKQPATQAPPSRAPRSSASGAVNITYRPREGDPINTRWHGHKFQGNVARPVTDTTLIDLAKVNPWFEVEGFERAKDAEIPDTPKTAEQYRAHAINWIKTAKSAREMAQLMREEASLRDACGVGSDDMDLIMVYYNPKFAELKRAE